MGSILIRYTDSQYVDSYLKGELYMSSLSSFWDISKNKISRYDVESGKVTEEDIKRAQEYEELNQQDFSEGVFSQVPKKNIPFINSSEIYNGHVLNDARFRLNAYGYCNLLCFFRVDYETTYNKVIIDEENIAYLAAKKDIKILPQNLKDDSFLETLINTIVVGSEKLSKAPLEAPVNVIQLPGRKMSGFGDTVIIIKNEREFIKRICKAVRKQGGHCIVGDVMYHKMIERTDADTLNKKHSITLISQKPANMDSLLKDSKDVITYGCLDKYEKFKYQKEWRVCWLQKELNNKPKILRVGDLSDIIEIVPSDRISKRLLEMFPGYIPGILETEKAKVNGTVSYSKFKKLVEKIDGKCQIIMEFC